MIDGQPSDEIPRQWYDTAILCNENCIANKVFTTLRRVTQPPMTQSPSEEPMMAPKALLKFKVSICELQDIAVETP
jgi:hypothetical protein